MTQTWHDLLFAHWPIKAETLRPLVPQTLPLDTFDGYAWVGVVPFRMDVDLRIVPSALGSSHFPELNVRTYVSVAGKPGVYFFSLDAASMTAVMAARTFFRLPYFHARMSAHVERGRIVYDSIRHNSNAAFQASYSPTRPVQFRKAGTLEHWLTERYCLYAAKGKHLYRADVHHAPWPLQDAEAEIENNQMAAASGITLPTTAPVLHFAQKLHVWIWPLRRV
jgi:uncharacterized protein YqjF (DUF2071 family)